MQVFPGMSTNRPYRPWKGTDHTHLIASNEPLHYAAFESKSKKNPEKQF